MQQATTLKKRIMTCQAEITRLNGERERCTAAIEAGEQDFPALDDLRHRRDRELAQAFIDQRKPNVDGLDKEIVAAERAPAREQASAARGAVNLINDRLAEQRTALAAARAELTTVVIEEVSRRRADAQSRFNGIVESLRSPLAELRALDSVTGTLRGVHVALPQSEQLVRSLLDDGIRVVNETGIRPPAWLRGISSEATEPYAALADEFRALGLEI
jgi:chromosome segregation ATPase